MLKTASEIIDALGGTQKLAVMLGVGASAVSNYRANGFPAAKYYALAKACKTAGLEIDESVFGIQNASGNMSGDMSSGGLSKNKRHFRYDEKALENISEADSPLNGFIKAGYERVETPILQPSAPFINQMGAEMQRRLYRFTDQGGEELCLRPDLTIPTALKYLADLPQGGKQMRYCYEGTAFRYQPRGAGKPEQFTQTGIEIIGGKSETSALEEDFDVLSSILNVITAAGLRDYEISLSDARHYMNHVDSYGFSAAITKKLKERLMRNSKLINIYNDLKKQSEKNFSKESRNIRNINAHVPNAMIAGRSGAEIAERLTQKQQSTEQAQKDLGLLDEFMDEAEYIQEGIIEDTPDYIRKSNPEVPKFVTAIYNIHGVNPEKIIYRPAHQQKMGYYTGLSFEISVPALDDRQVIAAGGRYDDLVQNIGSDMRIPAVGGAITLERLYEAVEKQENGGLENGGREQ